MHEVEKIGKLILITLEDHVVSDEIEIVKQKLLGICNDEDEAVVSLNLSKIDGSKILLREDIKRGYHHIIEFCNTANIRIYSYIYE